MAGVFWVSCTSGNMEIEKEIKSAMKEKRLIIGERSVVRGLKQNAIKSIICASNCPKDKYDDLKYYSRHVDVDVKKFKGNSRQLGEACAKPFNISVLGIKK